MDIQKHNLRENNLHKDYIGDFLTLLNIRIPCAVCWTDSWVLLPESDFPAIVDNAFGFCSCKSLHLQEGAFSL